MVRPKPSPRARPWLRRRPRRALSFFCILDKCAVASGLIIRVWPPPSCVRNQYTSIVPNRSERSGTLQQKEKRRHCSPFRREAEFPLRPLDFESFVSLLDKFLQESYCYTAARLFRVRVRTVWQERTRCDSDAWLEPHRDDQAPAMIVLPMISYRILFWC